METINTQKTQIEAALKENSELCAGIQHVINFVRLPEDMGKTWAEFFPLLLGWFDNYVQMASKLVMRSTLAQIQVLLTTTQLERLVKENTGEAYHQAVDQAEAGLDVIAEHIADDEDIATLDTPTLWSSSSCNSFLTQLPRHPRIQQTRRHCFGHNSLIRHRNGAFLDALERGRRRCRFGSGPSSRRSVDHSV
jgi:hypothetical protein